MTYSYEIQKVSLRRPYPPSPKTATHAANVKGYSSTGWMVLCIMILLVAALAPVAAAQTVMSVSSEAVAYGETVTLEVSIDNPAPFTGFQLDLVLPGPFTYQSGSAVLSGRADDHTVSAGMVSDGRLRIIAYSLNLNAFDGTSGPVVSVTYETGLSPGEPHDDPDSGPGSYAVTMENASVVSMDQEDMLDQVSGGIVTLIAPRLQVQPESVDFGEIPLDEEPQRSVQLHNTGNAPLQISGITIDDERFALVADPPGSIAPGSSLQLGVSFAAPAPGDYAGTISITSNDPLDPVVEVNLAAHAFSVNELYFDDKLVRSTMEERFEVRIRNMDPFTAFQFTVPLPEPVTYVENSVMLTDRGTDHVISADTSAGQLRVIAYSPSNASFQGNDGVVASLSLLAKGARRSYQLPLEDVIISCPEGQNILSDSYDGRIQIISPRLALSSDQIDFGATVVTDVATRALKINNTGNDTLIVDALAFDHEAFYSNTGMPLQILPWQEAEVEIHFHHPDRGDVTGTMLVRSNDVANDPSEVFLSGESIHQNMLKLTGTRGYLDEVSEISLELENMDPVSALQFDLVLPGGFTLMADDISLSDRMSGHSLAVNQVGGQIWRIIAYSSSLEAVSGENGALMYLPIETSAEPGDFEISLKDAVLSDPDAKKLNVAAEASVFRNRSREILLERTLQKDWNLVSLPVQPADRRVSQIFPEAVSHVFGYDDSYVISEYLDPGKGYWAEFEHSLSKVFEGEPVLHDTLHLSTGWNLIGSISDTVSRSDMQLSDPDLFASFLFGFDKGYYLSESILPGQGYWVRAAKEGHVILDSEKDAWEFQEKVIDIPHAGKHELISGEIRLDTLNSITFRDGGDNAMTLYFTSLHVPQEKLAFFELPPPPPAGAFDVRFASQRMVASLHDGSEHIGKGLEVRSEYYPITVTARIVTEEVPFELITGEGEKEADKHQLVHDEPFTLDEVQAEALWLRVQPDPDTTASDSGEYDHPQTFQLKQNYPNPFNSTTIIPFFLPNASEVTIEVFDVHGKRIWHISDRGFSAGRHELRFTAKDLATGIYVIRARADSWSDTRKMIHVK